MSRTVLFVCEFNSCRSQLAEAIARHVLPAGWRALSAGLIPTTVSEEVLDALAEAGINTAGLSSKSLDQVRFETVDEVVILAEPARHRVRACFPNANIVDWSMDDPLRTPGGRGAVRVAVCTTRDTLLRRLREHFVKGS